VSETEREGGIFDHEVEADQPPADEARVAAPPEDPVAPPEDPVAEDVPAAAEPDSREAESVPAEQEPQPALAEEEPEHAAGDLRIPAGIRSFAASPNGARRSVGIAVSRFNGEVTTQLLDGALAELEAAGVVPEAIEVMPVPGAFELPLAAMALAKSRRYSCVLALGCVIRGETPHFDFVAAEAASGVQLAGLETGVPVSFGVLTCDTTEQALARAGGDRGNKGAEAARSALEMVESLSQLRATLAT
jgi:6,7-dimethyl-8-ribityllumazine synthase